MVQLRIYTLRSAEALRQFSRDGTKLASSDHFGNVRLWDVASRRPIGEPLSGNGNPVYSVAFSSDGTRLASASAGRTVRLWEITLGQPIDEPPAGDPGPVSSVAFSPDGTKLASAGSGYNGSVLLWDRLWDIGYGCALATPYVARAQVQPYGPSGWEPKCTFAE